MRCAFALFVVVALASVWAQDKVKLEFYGESFCPYCQEFMRTGLNTSLEAAGVLDILDFHYYPWGNAYYNVTSCGRPTYDKDYSMFCWVKRCGVQSPPSDCFQGLILCQHGQGECVGNTIEGCAINLAPSPLAAARFNYCFEIQHSANPNSVRVCAAASGLDANAIINCQQGPEGKAADAANARATAILNPTHQGVPWVLLNGQQVDSSDLDNILPLICKAYKGTPPAACK